jgi:hypothetical protein
VVGDVHDTDTEDAVLGLQDPLDVVRDKLRHQRWQGDPESYVGQNQAVERQFLCGELEVVLTGQAGLPQFVGIFGVSGGYLAWSGA